MKLKPLIPVLSLLKAVLKYTQSRLFAFVCHHRSSRSVWTAAVHRRYSMAALKQDFERLK